MRILCISLFIMCGAFIMNGFTVSQAIPQRYKGNSCYTVYNSGTSWTANRETCKKSGGDLIVIETQGEYAYISSGLRLYSNKNSAGWHVGLEQNNGQWIWINGRPFEIGHWGAQEPSGDGPYAMMDPKGKLFDVSDDDNNGFICEKPLDPSCSGPPVVIPESISPSTPPGQVTQNPSQVSTKPPNQGAKPPNQGTQPPNQGTQPPNQGTQPPNQGTQPPNQGTQPPTQSPQQPQLSGFYKNCLESHNKYRIKHGSDPLQWSSDLQNAAQKWADHMASIDDMTHDMETEQGENLAYFEPARPKCEGEKKDDCVACEEMVADWYSEVKDYDYNTGEGGGNVITHFTQIVWKATEKLGVATAVSSTDKFYTVARYTPKGNMIGDFTKNVLPPTK